MTTEGRMTWILVAHPRGAKLFEHRPREGLRELDLGGRLSALPSPDVFEDAASPAARTAVMRYTLELADVLESGVRTLDIEALVLMADKRLLGTIRRHLSAATARRIHASFNVAGPDWDVTSVQEKLGPMLTVDRSTEGGADFF